MERIHLGDPEALDYVLERYWRPLVSYAERLVLDTDAAEDIVQNAMVRLWTERTRWTPTQKLRGFLYQITRNLALNERKKRQVRRDWQHLGMAVPKKEALTPADLAEGAALRVLLDRCVEDLPPRRREIFILSRYHGHTYRQIAEAMDIAPQTVANQMNALLDELREKLAPHLGEDGASDRASL